MSFCVNKYNQKQCRKSIWGPSSWGQTKRNKKKVKSAIISLRGQIQLLTKKTNTLEQQIEELREKAKAYMVKKNTNMAKIQLKKSKILEGELEIIATSWEPKNAIVLENANSIWKL